MTVTSESRVQVLSDLAWSTAHDIHLRERMRAHDFCLKDFWRIAASDNQAASGVRCPTV